MPGALPGAKRDVSATISSKEEKSDREEIPGLAKHSDLWNEGGTGGGRGERTKGSTTINSIFATHRSSTHSAAPSTGNRGREYLPTSFSSRLIPPRPRAGTRVSVCTRASANLHLVALAQHTCAHTFPLLCRTILCTCRWKSGRVYGRMKIAASRRRRLAHRSIISPAAINGD